MGYVGYVGARSGTLASDPFNTKHQCFPKSRGEQHAPRCAYVCVVWGANAGYALGAAVLGTRLQARETAKSVKSREWLHLVLVRCDSPFIRSCRCVGFGAQELQAEQGAGPVQDFARPQMFSRASPLLAFG